MSGAVMSERFPAVGKAWRPGFWRFVGALAVCVAAWGLACTDAGAAARRHRLHNWHGHGTRVTRATNLAHNWRWQPTHSLFRLTDPEKDAALVLDGETGRVLYARNADDLRHPASLTKMMTLYLLFEQLKNGQMTLATPITVSTHAAVQSPTKLYARPGTTISVDDAIKAVVVLSANDIAVAIAEAIGGTESQFAEMMTAKARSWGMTHTFYHNASGLPDSLQITSASDLGILARHLAYDFPQYFHYFSTYSFTWHGVTHFTHDNLIGRYDGADGIKTGYTGASGFNLVSSVVRNGAHIIGVVMGGTTARRRDTEMVRLLDDTFAAIVKNPMLVARESVPWQTLAQNAQAKPVIAGFQFGAGSSTPPSMTTPLPQPPLRSALASAGPEDEDAAESTPDPAYEPTAVTAKPPTPTPAKTLTLAPPTVAPKAVAPAQAPANKIVVASLEPASVRPTPAMIAAAGHPAATPAPARVTPAAAPAAAAPFILAAGEQVPQPKPKPSIPALIRVDDQAPSGLQPADDWTIQIGAFGNASLAQSELAAYAQKSADVLGDALRIVSPFSSAEGHIIYRARFGPFDENRAREVCRVLTERGQNCFAAVASR